MWRTLTLREVVEVKSVDPEDSWQVAVRLKNEVLDI